MQIERALEIARKHPEKCSQPSGEPTEISAQPGQPGNLLQVDPKLLKSRKLGTDVGRACFIHAIAHIEFNAINLALDAAYRFRLLPVDFYLDWLGVAADEARHHQMLVRLLQRSGYHYGDFPVHNGLWDMARRTHHNLAARMAMVPCVFEARGLDVTPQMIHRLSAVGDAEAARQLQQILQEEIAHVAVGVKWYNYACQQDGVDPVNHFDDLLNQYLPNRRQGPFNEEMRASAGFGPEWMARLKTREDRMIRNRESQF